MIDTIIPRRLLFFFMLVFSFSQQLKEFEVEIIQMDQGVTFPSSSKVVVKSPIPDLTFDSNRGIISVDDRGHGEWIVTLEPGSQRFEIKADGYVAWSERYSFKSGRAYECRIKTDLTDLDEQAYEITFELNAADVYVSMDQFAPILMTGTRAIYKLTPGEYTFHFEKSDFKPYSQTFRVEPQDQRYTIELLPDPGKRVPYIPPGMITITSDPPGAEVLINGQKRGSTPFSTDLTSGQHQLEIRKNLYYPDVSVFSLEPGKTQRVNIVLNPRFGTLSVTGSPADCDVFLDGKPVGQSPVSGLKVNSGNHDLSVRKGLYHDHNEPFTIADGQDKSIQFRLEPAFGTLEISTSPEEGAEVFLDGQSLGLTPLRKEYIPSGNYTVEVRRQYYGNATEMVTISDGKTTSRTLLLSTNVGTLSVTAPECQITVNGAVAGQNRYTEKLPPGTYTVLAEKENYYPEEREIFLSVGETEEVNFELLPIQGSVSILVGPEEAAGAQIYLGSTLQGTAPRVLTLLIGQYDISVRHDDFLPQTKPVLIRENRNQRLVFDLMTYKGSMEQQINKWRWRKNISLIGTVAFIGAAYYFQMQAADTYDKYNQAETAENAISYRKSTEQADRTYTICISVGGAGAVSWLYSWLQEKRFSKKINNN